jgi:ubiquinone/menaquinone biosynthesis C-methylase UbiE
MLRQSLDALARFSPRFRRMMMRTWYDALVVIDRQKQITFMNYGYVDLDSTKDPLVLNEGDEANRYAIQMYHHVAGAIDLHDEDVVEIGSGRGGGAAYVKRTFKPRSMRGIDISKNAVAFCNKYYANDGVAFSQGDAENIPLADESIDAVINVESSHCYGSMQKFLTEVHRVLRPGGYFLFADHRDQDKLDLLRQQFHDAGLNIVTETDITANVVAALRLDDDRKRALIRNSCPRYLQKEAEEFAAMAGTRTFDSFASRGSLYFSLAAQKRTASKAPKARY